MKIDYLVFFLFMAPRLIVFYFPFLINWYWSVHFIFWITQHAKKLILFFMAANERATCTLLLCDDNVLCVNVGWYLM